MPAGQVPGRLLPALAAALDGSGPAIAPIDPALPEPRLREVLRMLAPAVIETADGVRPTPGPAGPGVAPGVAVVVTTSGSTGEPKGVQLTAGALLHSARASLERIGARPGERWLCPLPVSHISGLGICVRSLVSGTEPVVPERFDPAGSDRAWRDCAHVSLVPTQLRRLLAVGTDLSAFATILLGGAAAPAALLEAARAAGARVVTTYGMSETCGGCVYDGEPLAGVRVRTSASGVIELGGPVLFAGYHGNPRATEAVLADGWFVTSDVGEVDGHGRLRVHGRADEVINTGGEKVAPAAVVAALEGCPGIGEAVVVGVPDPQWGERVTAVVVPTDPERPPRLADVRSWVRRRLPAYAAPRALVLVREVPLLRSGKPDREAVRSLARGHAAVREQSSTRSVTR